MLRNPELARFAACYLAAALACCIAAQLTAGNPAALSVAAAAVVLGAVVALFTRARYRALARLAAELDRCLSAERPIRIERVREGELAILENEIAKLLQKLSVSVEQLERERGLLADALADISHQLKTPLTSLRLMTELARKQTAALEGVDGDAREGLMRRLRAIERLQEQVMWLTTALLKLARIDAGAIALERTPVDVGELVRRAAEPLAIAFDLADVELAVDVEDGCSFPGDLAWTAEALTNILKNCLEHTPAAGCVSIRAHEDALAVRIRVSDTGSGIAPEDLPHIFERFYRGHREISNSAGEPNPGGVGIGLALARSLIAAQDGRLVAGNVADAVGNVTGAFFEIAFFKTVV
ncbi:sensor histidine kinase [Collinsella tanakaei]|uniref:sensor histidine kinase n=1 Tax=Collinsella tanakaei TaxID=626935 RepID=UPI00195EFF92|nr:HAMP domain-containing sensor histidine kinase [Collinsella tanakaei]MBM6868415.1 HAMP domain-containing histidine kinase [Collinsella tanakaei]